MGKQVATDRRSSLGSEHFEELQVMGSAWKSKIVNWSAVNSEEDEKVDMSEFESLLLNNMSAAAWDKDMGIVDDTDEDTL